MNSVNRNVLACEDIPAKAAPATLRDHDRALVMLVGFVVLVGVIVLTGCGGPKVNNTRLQADDLVAMTDRMAVSLANAEVFISGESPNDVGQAGGNFGGVIVVDRVINLTNDLIPEGEKKAFLARLRAELSGNDALQKRGVKFVLNRELGERLVERSGVEGKRLQPTHVLAATFYAATQAGREMRSDTYLCSFQLFAVGSDIVVWENSYEVKREVLRNRFD